MRIGRWSTVVIGVVLAGAVATAGIALAAGSSSATFGFSPDRVPKKKYKKGSLFVHTHTDYSVGSGTNTDRAQLYFDDDLKINTKRIPRCDNESLPGLTMAQAMAACGKAKIGRGRAQANAAAPGDVKACVLAFNGKRSKRKPTILLFTRANVVGPISCSSPSTNTQGNTTAVLEGVLKKARGDYGTRLDIPHISTASALPLSDFKVTIKRGRYVSARCHDRNRKWNMKAKFTYTNPSSSDTARSRQSCRRKH